MTLSTTATRVTYTGNGVTTAFAVSFPFFAASEIEVIERVIATGTETVKTLTTHYTVSGGNGATGTVTVVGGAPSSSVQWIILRDTARTQEIDYTPNDPFPAETHEQGLDRLKMNVQELDADIDRALRFPRSDSDSLDAELPSSVARASKYLAFDASGSPVVTSGTTSLLIATPFAESLLDDTNAAAARTTLDVPSNAEAILDALIDAKGDLIVGTAADTPARKAVGSNGHVLFADSTQADGLRWGAVPPPNLLINGGFQFNQRLAASNVDDTYAHDRWYALTQTGAIALTTLSDVENTTPFMARLTQSQAAVQRMGYAQIIEGKNCKRLRGQQVTFKVGRYRCSASQAIRFAVLEWTGTEDVVTSDVVNDWTSSDYGEGAAKFFVDANITISGVISATPSAATMTNGPELTVTLGSAFNNLIVFVWTEGTAAQNITLDLSKARLAEEATASPFVWPDWSDELKRCQRYYEKTYDMTTPPGSTSGDITNGLFIGPCFYSNVRYIPTQVPLAARKRSASWSLLYWDRDGNASKLSGAQSFVWTDNLSGGANQGLYYQGEGSFVFRCGDSFSNDHIGIHFSAESEL